MTLKIRESDRIKAVKLLLKIFTNILNHPTQLHKYGNLKFDKIGGKLSNCRPALKLLALSGFQLSETETRLIWLNTDENMVTLKHIKNVLSSMVDSSLLQSNGQELSHNVQQTKMTQTTSNINAIPSQVCPVPFSI